MSVVSRHRGFYYSAVMKVSALGAAIWGARNVPCADAFIYPAVSSSAASNAFVARRSSFVSSTSLGLALERRTRTGQAAAEARRRHKTSRHGTSMLFDFIKQRAQEGVEQTQNLVSAAQEGRLDEALRDTSAYVKDRRVSRNVRVVRIAVDADANSSQSVKPQRQCFLTLRTCSACSSLDSW